MTSSATVWVVLGLAFVAANLPFLFGRTPPTRSSARGRHVLGWQLLALLVLYFVVGFLALLLEKNAYGVVYPQNWEFYVSTLCLFVVFAFPGFVYCHLWRGNRRSAGGEKPREA